MKEMIWPYVRMMRLDRPIGSLLLLWPTLVALWIAAEGLPDLWILAVFIIGVIVMRSAGCVINDFADRKIDGHIWRTQSRPLAAGDLEAKDALLLFSALCIVAFLLVLSLNKITVMMSVIGVFLAATYPFMKRYTYFPQVYLGMAFGWAIPMAFTAITESVPAIGWLLFMANIIWATIYDTYYAMADREDDLLVGVKSTAILFGDDDLVIIGTLEVCFLFVMILIGSQLSFTWPYYLSLLVAGGLFVYQQYLARERDPQQCFSAFMNNNWVGGVIFIGTLLHYVLHQAN